MNEYESITDDDNDNDLLSNRFEDKIKKDNEYLIKTTIAAPLPIASKPQNPYHNWALIRALTPNGGSITSTQRPIR